MRKLIAFSSQILAIGNQLESCEFIAPNLAQHSTLQITAPSPSQGALENNLQNI